MSTTKLNRSDVLNKLMEVRGNALAIAGLGSPVWDLAASDHQPENFYNWGGMGCAISMGLGCALAQPKRNIWVITGDGEALMGVGSFATVANQRPDNLVIIILDNEHTMVRQACKKPIHRGAQTSRLWQLVPVSQQQ